jgi:two-component SAPR family response regulator
MTDQRASLSGLDVLLVEDESLVSLLLEDMLHELGAGKVRHASRLDAGLSLAAARKPDLAVLDVNIAGKAVFPLARKLAEDSVPLLFITGYGRDGLAEEWATCEVLQKPLTLDQLEQALHRALARRA